MRIQSLIQFAACYLLNSICSNAQELNSTLTKTFWTTNKIEEDIVILNDNHRNIHVRQFYPAEDKDYVAWYEKWWVILLMVIGIICLICICLLFTCLLFKSRSDDELDHLDPYIRPQYMPDNRSLTIIQANIPYTPSEQENYSRRNRISFMNNPPPIVPPMEPTKREAPQVVVKNMFRYVDHSKTQQLPSQQSSVTCTSHLKSDCENCRSEVFTNNPAPVVKILKRKMLPIDNYSIPQSPIRKVRDLDTMTQTATTEVENNDAIEFPRAVSATPTANQVPKPPLVPMNTEIQM